MRSPWLLAQSRGLPVRGLLIEVDVVRQRITLWFGSRVLARYRISTSRFGVGARAGSFKTPPGWHRVVRWIGSGRPLGSVFKSRRATGRIVAARDWRGPESADLILTRILRLRGLEPGRNSGSGVDSYARYIYIHGTNHEDRLGRPASRGCIRMGNRDVADLFRRTRGRITWCWIH